MDHKIELLGGLMRFSPLWLIIDLLLLAHFFLFWVYSARKDGWKIDFWHVFLLHFLVVPLLIMYPFNAAEWNALTIGEVFYDVDHHIDRAFGISILGYCFLWLGRACYRFKPKLSGGFLSPFTDCFERCLKSKKALYCLLALTLAAVPFLLFLEIQEGYLLRGRALFLQWHSLRPLFNLTLSLYPIAFLFLAVRIIIYKEKGSAYWFAVLLCTTLLLGVRGILMEGLLTLFCVHCYSKRGRISLGKLILIGFCCLTVLLYLDQIRHQSYNPLITLGMLFLQVFYGNTFSDTRDFGWILSNWNECFVLGKTYIAGLVAFVPRFLSSFREQWSVAMFTSDLVEFNTEQHAGLRMGLFGESYMNFGLIGVAIVGFIGGFSLRHADLVIKRAVEEKGDLIKGLARTFGFTLVSLLFTTVAVWSVYVLIAVILALSVIARERTKSNAFG